MAGARQHYIPAAVVGGFSETAAGPRRRRTGYARSIDRRTTRLTRAEDVAWAADLYTLKDPRELPPALVDNIWEGVEKKLPEAIEYLANESGDLRADIWMKVLVPYAAELFVRPLDFDETFSARFGEHAQLVDQISLVDNAKFARAINLQRMYYPVMDAYWVIVHNSSSLPFIINDCGMAILKDEQQIAHYFLPLDRTVGVDLHIGPSGNGMYPREHPERISGPKHRTVNSDEFVRTHNSLIYASAINEIYGPTKEVVEQAAALGDPLRQEVDASALPRNGQLLVHPGAWARDHEMVYFGALSMLEGNT
jgi:hypothetical protein